jgi:hypothetical protein
MKEGTGMNVDDLTVGEVKQLQALLTSTSSTGPLERKRVVLVVDRGWIFAGDQSRTPDGMVRLDNAVHVFRWESIGFAAVVADPKNGKVDLRPVDPVEVPDGAVVFRVPVPDGWGL